MQVLYTPRGFSRQFLEAPSPPSTTSTSTSSAAAAAVSTTAATSATASIVLLAILWFGGVVHEERIEWKRVGENKVADVVSANG